MAPSSARLGSIIFDVDPDTVPQNEQSLMNKCQNSYQQNGNPEEKYVQTKAQSGTVPLCLSPPFHELSGLQLAASPARTDVNFTTMK